MSTKLLIPILFLFSFDLLSQDSSKVTEGPPAIVIQPPAQPPVRERPVVSAIPTAKELADLFIKTERGEFDPFEVIGKVAEQKESAVAGLNELLFSETLRGSTGMAVLKPNKLYAIFCLQAVGSQTAYAALLQAATSQPDANIKGTALHSYAAGYLQKARSEALTPEKEIIHLFLGYVGNGTQVDYLQKSFDELALEVLKDWINKDFDKKAIGNSEQWWLQNKDKLTWNKKAGRFEVR